jgi:hypothetical protein
MKIKNVTLLSIFCLSLLFWTCSHTKENTPQPTQPVIVAPSDLAYSSKVIEVIAGQSAKSVKPTLKGDAPFTFSLTSNPAANGLSIDNEGIISVANNLPENTYKISVTVKNASGSNTFTDALTVIVKSTIAVTTAPANLKYTPNTLTLTQNTSANSVVPTITGTTPITYTITTNPSTNGITINTTTGVISAASTLATGTYTVNVTATNATITPVVFNSAYTITVNASNMPTKTTFEGDVRTILTNNGCISCHSDLSNYNTSKNRVNLILDRIQRQSNQGGFMPQGGIKMQDAQINSIKKWLSDGLLER